MCHYNTILEVFDVLNQCKTPYLVLRNYEKLLEPEMYLNGHGDIDLLCAEGQEIVRVLGAQTNKKNQYPYKGDGIHYYIYVGDERVSLDIRYVGDDYYCQKWEQEILKNRVLYNGFYVMDKENYFYTLIYHAILQKDGLSDEYLIRLTKMSKTQGVEMRDYSESSYLNVLEWYMRKKGYNFTYPVDYLVPARFQMINRQMIVLNWRRWLCHWLYWRKIKIVELLVEMKHQFIDK